MAKEMVLVHKDRWEERMNRDPKKDVTPKENKDSPHRKEEEYRSLLKKLSKDFGKQVQKKKHRMKKDRVGWRPPGISYRKVRDLEKDPPKSPLKKKAKVPKVEPVWEDY